MASDKTPMLERPSYIAGVERAKKRDEQRRERSIQRFDSLFEVSAKALIPSLLAAKEHAEANRAKYGEKPSLIRRILVVPKGSVPRRGSWDEYFAELDAKREEAKGDGGNAEAEV